MNIALLFGGLSYERNVSINGGKSVYEALKSLGHNVIAVDPAQGADGLIKETDIFVPDTYPTAEELAKFTPRNIIDCVNSSIFDNIDVAFLVLHGKYGEDGMIQSLLELRGIPYTGSKVKASAISMDKLASKLVFAASGITIAPWLTIRRDEVDSPDVAAELRDELGKDLVIKPNDQGSAIGVTILRDGREDEITAALKFAAEYSKTIIAEKYIPGKEITVGIVGETALPVVEIIPSEGFYDYKHKYTHGQTKYQCPAEIPADIAEFTQNLCISAYSALGCEGFGRADFRLTPEWQPVIMEMNTIPGFTSTSLVPMAAKEIGIEFPQLCQQLIDIALEK